MTVEIVGVLLILAAAMTLFVTEKLRVDIVALLVLVSLAISGILEPRQALSGFSNPAVVTVWAVFILSGGLQRTGVAGKIGHQVLRLAGESEVRLVIAIMLAAGFMSAFMNNVGVAALLLPVVMDVARRTRTPPSKLLIPLSYSCLLGGLTTMIGTPPNILITDAVREHGLEPFELFDFTPVGSAVMVAGILFMVLFGRRMLPIRAGAGEASADGAEDLGEIYNLGEQFRILHLPEGSALAGKTLAESRLGSALGVSVIGIVRGGQTQLAPGAGTALQAGDRLLVEGRPDRLTELRDRDYLAMHSERLAVERLESRSVEVATVELPPTFVGQSLRQVDFRRRFGLIVLSFLRDGRPLRRHLENVTLARGDRLLVQGPRERLDALRDDRDFAVAEAAGNDLYELEQLLMEVRVPTDSALVGKTLVESRLGDALGLGVLGIVRGDEKILMPEPTERLVAGDTLLVKGRKGELAAVEGLGQLEVESAGTDELEAIQSDEVGFAEVVISPRAGLVGKTLKELLFREKYGLNVVAVSREGEIHRSNVRDLPLAFGDALLVYGPRRRLAILGREPDFLVLTEEAQEPPRLEKAPVAALVMAAVIVPVIFGWIPIYISAVAGAAVMVMSKALTMDEAYRFIEWRAVFLIAGMLPLGLALEESGAALFLTEQVVNLVGDFGPRAILATFFLMTAALAQVMPTSAAAILMAPIALSSAAGLGLSPYALAMTVAVSASASFLSPVAHPANLLVMGPGGYKFTDYMKVGIPLNLTCLVVVLVVLPLVWPLTP